MRKLFAGAIVVLAMGLGGCAEFNTFETKVSGAWSAVTGATVSPAAIEVSASAFDALEATAKNYINPALNKRCDGTNGPICRDPKATIAINTAIRSGRVARNNAKQFLRDHPGQLGSQGLYDALQTSVTTLRGIFSQYGIGGAF
jgi:Flp pilus assembly pilin Flp